MDKLEEARQQVVNEEYDLFNKSHYAVKKTAEIIQRMEELQQKDPMAYETTVRKGLRELTKMYFKGGLFLGLENNNEINDRISATVMGNVLKK